MMRRLVELLRQPGVGPAGRVERRVEWLVLALLVLLLLQLLFAGARLFLRPQAEPVPPSVLGETQGAMHAMAAVPAAERREILARPLFWVSRRPLAPVTEEALESAATEGNLGKVKLVGLFGTGATAGIIVLDGEERRRVLQGESIEGWKLESVSENQVVVSSSGKEKILVLKQQSGLYQPDKPPPGESVSGKKAPGKKQPGKENKVQPPSELGFGTPRF